MAKVAHGGMLLLLGLVGLVGLVGPVGPVLGLAGAAVLMRTQLFGVTPADPMSYVITIVMLMSAVAVASWLPARRATNVSPLECLRVE